LRDPSLSPFGQKLGPGVHPHVSYVNALTNTSVENLNVQLLGGDSKELHSGGVGALMVAMTDLNLLYQENGESKEVRLYKGNLRLFPGPTPTVKNSGKNPAAWWFWK